jgi:hypothetical protein
LNVSWPVGEVETALVSRSSVFRAFAVRGVRVRANPA